MIGDHHLVPDQCWNVVEMTTGGVIFASSHDQMKSELMQQHFNVVGTLRITCACAVPRKPGEDVAGCKADQGGHEMTNMRMRARMDGRTDGRTWP